MNNKISKIAKAGIALMFCAYLAFSVNTYAQDTPVMDNTDAEILATIIAVDASEINAALAVQKRQVELPVMEYAQILYTAHTDNMTKANSLASELGLSTTDTKATEELKQKHADELAKISMLEGVEFGKAYVDAMIKGHTEVLEMIETKLMPAVTDEKVKFFLIDTQSHVKMHLDEAKKLK